MALQYGADTALSITAGSLASGSAQSSAAFTSALTNNTDDYLIGVSILTTSTAPSGNKLVAVYAYMSEDGTNYSGGSSTVDDVDGTDKTLTALGDPTALKLLGVIPMNQGAAAVTLRGVFSLREALGVIPPKWGIVLFNDGGTALGATVSVKAREVYYS